MISFLGLTKNLMSVIDIICTKSQEASHLNDLEYGDWLPGDCPFRLEYSRRDDFDFYQLNKFELTHSH